MNRRGFFGTIGNVAAGFMILPGAGRVWKAVVDQKWIVNVEWANAEYGVDMWWHNGKLVVFQDIDDSALVDLLNEIQVDNGELISGVFNGFPPFDQERLRKAKHLGWPLPISDT